MRDFHQFLQGFSNFRNFYYDAENDLYNTLRQGQNPHALVIACSDSRVDPASLMGCNPGDIFVVRNVANLVPHCGQATPPDAVAAALEYAVCHLQVEHIIVLGHSDCGGIHALLDPALTSEESYIKSWMSLAAPALQRLNPEILDEDIETQRRHCEEASVLQSIENLLSYDWIKERVARHALSLHAWYFDMHSMSLLAYFPEKENFEPLAGHLPYQHS